MADHAPKHIRAKKAQVDATNMLRAANIHTDVTIAALEDKLPKSRPQSVIQRDLDKANEQLEKQKKRLKALTKELSNRSNPANSKIQQEINAHILETYGEPMKYDEETSKWYKQETGARTLYNGEDDEQLIIR